MLQKKDTKFTNTIIVSDNGNDNNEGPKLSKAEVSITVVGSDKQPPKIVRIEPTKLRLRENFSDFTEALVTIEAEYVQNVILKIVFVIASYILGQAWQIKKLLLN